MATWNLSETKHHLFICNGSSCNKHGAEELTQAIRKEISEKKLDNHIHTTRTLCNGRCTDKCVLISYPEGKWFKDLKPEDASSLINSLHTNEEFNEKLSHYYNGEGFERNEGIEIGVTKDNQKVKKVSKVF